MNLHPTSLTFGKHEMTFTGRKCCMSKNNRGTSSSLFNDSDAVLKYCWQGKYHQHRMTTIWKEVLLSFMRVIWCERNSEMFEGVEFPHHAIKQSV